METIKRTKGTVKWFNDAKGFGFVESEDHFEPIFLHYSAIMTDGFKTVSEGAIVEFDLVKGSKGYSAMGLTVLVKGIEKDEE